MDAVGLIEIVRFASAGLVVTVLDYAPGNGIAD